MSFRLFLTVMFIATIIAWVAWFIIIYFVNPDEASAVGIGLFYFTLLTGLTGILSLIGILYRIYLRNRQDVIIREVKISFRHALFLSTVCVSALALSTSGLLRWWVVFVLIAIISGIEYLFILMQDTRRS